MTAPASAPHPNHPKRKRSRRKLVIVCAAIALLLLFYAALPLLIPKSWIADQIVSTLTDAVDRPVAIKRISIGWRSGVVIEGLSIGRKRDYGDGDFVHVERVHCGFTPLRTLFTGRLDHLRVENADCWAVIGANGKLNLTDWPAADPDNRPRLLTTDWQLIGTRIHLVSDVHDQPPVTVAVGKLACRLDPETGEASYAADATMNSVQLAGLARFEWDGQLSVPSLNPGVELEGGTTFRWDRLDLSSLPVQWLPPEFAIAALSGTSSGKLETRLEPKNGLTFDVDVTLDGLRARQQGSDTAEPLGTVEFKTEGSYHADARALRLASVRLHFPDRITITGPTDTHSALEHRPLDRNRAAVDLAIETPDCGALLAFAPFREAVQAMGLTVSGPARADIAVVSDADSTQYHLTIDARDTVADWPHVLTHRAGMPARIDLKLLDGRRSHHVEITDLTAEWDTASLEMFGRLPREGLTTGLFAIDHWLMLFLQRGGLSIDLEVADAGRLADSLPALATLLKRANVAGPLSARFSHRITAGADRADWRITLPKSFRFDAPSWVRVSGDHDIAIEGAVVYPNGDEPGRLSADMRLGDGRVRIRESEAAWRFTVATSDTGATQAASPVLGAFLHAPIELEHVETLLPHLPVLQRLIADIVGGPSRLSGDARLDLTLNAEKDETRTRWRLAGAMNADRMDAEFADWWTKTTIDRADLTFGWSNTLTANGAAASLEASGDLAGLRFDGTWRRDTAYDRFDINVDIRDAKRLRDQSPRLNRLLDPLRIHGTSKFAVAAELRDGAINGTLAVDLTGSSLARAGDSSFQKPAGTPLTANTKIALTPVKDAADHWRLVVDAMNLGVGMSQLSVSQATAEVVRNETAPAPRGWTLASANMRGTLDLRVEPSLNGIHEQLDHWMNQLDAAGRATADLTVAYGNNDEFSIGWNADATRMHVNASPKWMKSAGTTAQTEGHASVTGLISDAPVLVKFDRVALTLGDATLAAKASCALTEADGWNRIGDWRIEGDLRIGDLTHWPNTLPELTPIQPQGNGSVSIDFSGDAANWKCNRFDATFENVAMIDRNWQLWLDGAFTFSPERWTSDGLRVRIGQSDAIVFGEIEDPLGNPRGDLLLHSEMLDFGELSLWMPASNVPEPEENKNDPSIMNTALVRRILAWIDRADVNTNVRSARTWFYDSTSKQRFLVDEMTGEVAFDKGRMEWPVRCILNGGPITGTIGFDRTVSPAIFFLDYNATDVAAFDPGTGVDVRPYLERTFPGLTASGPISMVDSTRQRFLEPEDPDNYPVGEGELIVDGGVIVGKAAPDYITRLFPHLDFARFKFRRMHDWFTKHQNGRIDHHMVYIGNLYHIYSDGSSWPDGRIKYEVGIDFLASFDKESWARSGQGRLPLFTKEGIAGPDGNLINEEVRYVPFVKLADSIFVSNNIIETSYLALQERIRRLTDKDKP